MERLWLITNLKSGSADGGKAQALEAVCAEQGLVIVGRTLFPAEALPDAAMLGQAGADTLMLYAGDGTINAALCRLGRWPGAVLILPGGTMNMLAKRLHGDKDAEGIVHAAYEGARTVRLHHVEVGARRAFVGLIAGPAATWGHARELAREGRWRRMVQAARHAWTRSWSGEIVVRARRQGNRRYNAVYVTARDNGSLTVSAIAAEGWADLARLGWEWLKGDWRQAPGVDESRASELVLASGRRVIHALFDGEEVLLKSPVHIRTAMSELSFVTTVEGG